jgi:hypothetical protein
MDPYTTAIGHNLLPAWPSSTASHKTSALSPPEEWEGIRKAMGYARAMASRVDLASMQPMGELTSTGYCLAASGKEYLIYLPSEHGWLRTLIGSILNGLAGEQVEVDLSTVQGTFDVEWIDVGQGQIFSGDPVKGGQRLEFQAPFAGDAVLHVKAREGASRRL